MLSKKLTAFVFLMAFSFSAFAVDRPAAYAACMAYGNAHDASYWGGATTCPDNGQAAGNVTGNYRMFVAASGNYYGFYYQWDSVCAGGGAFSLTTHTCPVVCISPYIINTVNNTCYIPKECAYPETDNGSGVCANNTCPSGQVRNPTTNLCQVQPSCGSKESYDVYTNTCKLYPLNCPGNTHASTANDACLSNAPLVCPTGQHDDGTYNCVADTKSACTSNQQAGYINGVAQCITKPNLDTGQAAALAASTAANNAGAAVTTAQNALNAADTALTADPTNVNKQRAQQAANDALQVATAGQNNLQAQAQNTNLTQTNALLGSIDQTLKAPPVSDISQDYTNTLNSAFSAVPTDLGAASASNTQFVTFSPFGISSQTCTGIPMHYKSLQYDFNPCEKLALWRTLMSWFCAVYTGFSIVSIARQD